MIRKAKTSEVPDIRQFLEDRRQHGIIPRSLAYLYSHVRDYFIIEGCADGHFCGVTGVAALHICWEGIGEIRSLSVRPDSQNGRGSDLVAACLDEARKLRLLNIFLLTLIPDYFQRFGFRVVTRDDLPPIAWADCVNCIKFPNCNETPMVLHL